MFQWFNKDILVMSIICGLIGGVMYSWDQGLFMAFLIYFACIAIFNLNS